MRQKPSSNDRKGNTGRDFKKEGNRGSGSGFKRDDSRGGGSDDRKRSFDKSDRPKRDGYTDNRRAASGSDEKRSFRRDDDKGRGFGKPERENKRFEDRGDKKPFRREDGEKRPYRRDDASEKRGFRKDDGEKRSYKRDDTGEKKSYRKDDGERRSFGNDGGERKTYGKSDGGDRRSFGEGRENKRFDSRDEKRPYKRDNDESRGDRKSSFRKDDGEKRSYDRQERGDGKRFEDRGDKKPFSKEEKGKDGAQPERRSNRFEDQDLSFGKQGGRKEMEKKPRKPREEGDDTIGGQVKPRVTLKKAEKKDEGDFSKAYPLGSRKVSGPFRKQFEEEQAAEKAGDKPKRERKPKAKDNDEDGGEIKEMTLNKYIAHSGTCSRRDAAEMVKQGKVKINGELALDPGYRVQPYDVVTIAGKKLTPQKNRVYILLNKPKGYITTTEDPEGRKTVMDLVADAEVDRLFPVGRLDRNTSGLLLLTNDGDLAQKLSHPSYEIKKVYQVTLDRALTKADFDKVVDGFDLDDGPVHVDALAYLDEKNELGLEIHSGRNRVVRRIFETLGYEVEKLDRVMYAGLTKKNLPRSKWRFLDEKEIILLKHFKS